MIESTPKVPYSGYSSDLTRVEANMRRRRARLMAALKPNEIAPTITSFPMMGVGNFTEPAHNPGGPIGESKWIPDACTNPHPRFGALTQNIRKRRGSNVDIRVPIYIDRNTFASRSARRREMVTNIGHANPDRVAGLKCDPDEKAEERNDLDSAYDVWLAADDVVVMDHMAYGMGSSCLQVTFQARDIDESRRLFDTLVPMAPLMLALTAAAPIFKGQLVDTDVRWDVIAASVDDRTPMECGMHISRKELGQPNCPLNTARPEMAGGGVRRIPKSRYGSVSNYITAEGLEYNDLNAPFDADAYKQLRSSGIDDALSRHIAHLFIRDPLVIHDGMVELDDDVRTDHFENIQGTNWQTLRWKPPPPDNGNGGTPGWRTEFRSMELQLTDFENAAFSVFVVLVSRVMLAFNLNTYIPMSLVDENMRAAHRRSACRSERFWFRRHMDPSEIENADQWEDQYELMSLQQIMMGKGSYFPGLIPMVFAYLDALDEAGGGVDRETRNVVTNYMQFIQQRATGQLMTTAEWMRNFVTSHPDYKEDSVVTQRIAYDLMERCHHIGIGTMTEPSLLPSFYKAEPLVSDNPYPTYLSGNKIEKANRERLLRRYAGRSSFL